MITFLGILAFTIVYLAVRFVGGMLGYNPTFGDAAVIIIAYGLAQIAYRIATGHAL